VVWASYASPHPLENREPDRSDQRFLYTSRVESNNLYIFIFYGFTMVSRAHNRAK